MSQTESNSKPKLWRFSWSSRAGEVESYFVATREKIDEIMGSYVYFGEILGKYSEVSGIIEESDLTEISEDSEFIEKFLKIIGSTGYNPLDYLDGES